MELIIRKAEIGDLELLTDMRLEMRRERETVALTISEGEFREKTLAFFRWGLETGQFVSYIAFCDGEAAACSGVSIQRLPPSYSITSGLRGYVTNMYTRTKWRGHGLATKLMDALVEECRRQGCQVIDLNASAAGKPVYVKYGFTDVANEMKLDI